MAEPEVNTEQENKISDEGVIGEEDVEENINSDRNSDVLAGLNLVLILSSLSSPDEEHLNFEERVRGKLKHRAKSRPDLNTTRQKVNGFQAVERQKSKVPTKIRDSRHNRRL